MNWALIIIVAVVVILLVVLILWLISKSKGKIEINLGNFNFSPGDVIEGTIILKLKRPIHAKSLNVRLMGLKKNKRYGAGSYGMSKQSSMRTIFYFKQ